MSKCDDAVNSPEHYRAGEIECIDAIKAMTSQFTDGCVGYCLGNVLKYIWRHERKDNPIQDLEKAAWYLDKAIEIKRKVKK